jgi:malto-oligosyltrehalose trehalohydrolase
LAARFTRVGALDRVSDVKRAHEMPFGATVMPGGVLFSIWAPTGGGATVEVDGRRHPMKPGSGGFFSCFDPDAAVGSRYSFRFDGVGPAVPDPASRFNPDGVHASSEVVDPNAYEWRDREWRGAPWNEATVVYELHVGTFTSEGTYAAAAKRLDYLASLGVTALELMPLAATAGRWNWGYDGVLPFAPHAGYGAPEDLKRFVDAAHERGLMVLLDVVYNHFGPEGNYLGHYAQHFFTAKHKTPWGNAINFDDESSDTVRRFFVHNALYWLEEYHFDGLRLDAVHAILDDSEPCFLRELAAAVRALPGRERHLILENDHNDAALLARERDGRPIAYTAQWNDDFHHALHVLLTGDQRGHYGDYADAGAMLLKALTEGFVYQGQRSEYRGGPRGSPSRDLPPDAFVNFLQNHDQIGNRPDAARLWSLLEPAPMFAAETLLALLPTPILLFMGDEFHAPSLFPFFCDYTGELARAVTEGRRTEFASLWSDVGADAVPGPTTEAARSAAVLDWTALAREPHDSVYDRSRQRLALRHRELAPRMPARTAGGELLGRAALRAYWTLDDRSTLLLSANIAPSALKSPPPTRGRRLLATQSEPAGEWPPWYVEWAID